MTTLSKEQQGEIALKLLFQKNEGKSIKLEVGKIREDIYKKAKKLNLPVSDTAKAFTIALSYLYEKVMDEIREIIEEEDIK